MVRGWRSDGPVSLLEEAMDIPAEGLIPFEVKSLRISKTCMTGGERG